MNAEQNAQKYAIVTGAASGIGKEVARQLADDGWRVAITDINAEGLAQTAADIGELAIDATPLDISNHEAVERWAGGIVDKHGVPHSIYHVGGISVWGNIATMPLEKWEKLIDVNLMGTIHVIRAFVPSMMEAGPLPGKEKRRLVCVSSSAGILGLPWHAAYSASKGGVLAMLEVLRFDLAPFGINVHAVAPGAVDTGLVRTIDIDGVDQSNPKVRRAKKLFQKHAVSPAKCAQIIVKGVRKNKYLITTGGDVKLGRWAQVNAPFLYRLVLGGLNRGFQWIAKDAAV